MTIHTALTSGYDPHQATTVQAFLPSEDERFSLPGDVTKARAIRNAEAALRLFGASATEILVFRQIADTTGRAAWHSTTEAAVNFRRQADMAHEAGIGERQFRRIETSLQAFGVIARTTAANGYRGRRSGRAATMAGISLEPCIANHAAIVSLLRQAEAAERERQDTRLRASMARRRLGQSVAAVQDPERRAELTERLDETERRLKPACLRTATHNSLTTWLDAILELERQVTAVARAIPETAPDRDAAAGGPAQDTGSEPQENTQIQADMSGAPDIGVRRHIQPTTETGNESCNPGGAGRIENEGGAGCSPPAPEPVPESGRNGRESPETAADDADGELIGPKMAARLTAATLRSLASRDAELYLDAFSDWRDAIPLILRELGINASAYEDAVEVMGHTAAFVALLVIDRNRFHPTSPVRSPGGTLRRFTVLAAQGRLNLTRSVNGIWERERAGRQPRGLPVALPGLPS